MGEVIQFVTRSERERLRLIKEARAIYDSIFPQEPLNGQHDNSTISRAVGRGDGSNLA